MKRNSTLSKKLIAFLLISLMIVSSTTNAFAVVIDNVDSSSQKDNLSSVSDDNKVTLTQNFDGIQEGNKYCPGIKNYPDLPFYVYLQKEGTSSDTQIFEDGISIDEGNYKIRVLEPTPNAYTNNFPYSIFVFIGGEEISLNAKTGTKKVNSITYSICTSNEYYHFTGNEEISVTYNNFNSPNTITINPNGGIGSSQTREKYKGFPFHLPADVASLGIKNIEGKYFIGYLGGTTDPKNLVFDNESNTYIIDTPIIVNTISNYKVLWSDTPISDTDYTVSYSYDGAPSGTTPPPPVIEKVGKTISLPNEPSISGATFLGWYYNNEKIENATTILGNMQIVGRFESSIDPIVTFSETGETGTVKINESIIHSGDTVPQGDKNITITPPDGYIVKNVTNLGGIIVNSNGEATVNKFPIFDDINFDITYAEKPEFTIESKEIHFNENIDNPAHLTKGPNDGTFNYTSSETSKIICNGSNVTTSDHITSAAKNVTCYATYSLGLWTSSPIEYTISVIKPTVSKSDQTLIYGERKHVEYGLTNNDQAAYEKTIDGTNYPYFSFSSSNPDKISVDEDNNISTGALDDDEYATAGITVTYHVNPNCTYSSTYNVDTANISSFSWHVSKNTLKLGDKIICTAEPSIECPGYTVFYSTTTSTSSAKVTINQDTNELTYTQAPPKENNYVTITAAYKPSAGSSRILAYSTYDVNLGGVTVKSDSGVKKSILTEKDQQVNISEVSQPIVTGEGVGDESNYEYTYKITSGQEYVTQDSKNPALFTSVASGVTKVSVSAKLKDSENLVKSSYTFTITGNYEDDTPFEPKGCKVSVGGNISAYIWMTIPKPYRVSGTYVKFTYHTKSETKNIIVDFNNADIDVIDSNLVYGFPCEIAAKEMTTNITYALYDSNNTMISDKEYSFNLYDNYFNSPKINKSQLQDTINKLQNYGARAQLHFNFNTSKLANANLTEDQKALSSAQEVFEQTKSNELSISGQEPGVSYYGASLVTESLLRTKMYFVVENGFSVPICTINGKNVTAEKAGKTSKGIIYYITSEGDTLKAAGDVSQYKIGNMVIKYSPLSYIHSITGSSSANETNKNVTIAMYDYYKSIPDEE